MPPSGRFQAHTVYNSMFTYFKHPSLIFRPQITMSPLSTITTRSDSPDMSQASDPPMEVLVAEVARLKRTIADLHAASPSGPNKRLYVFQRLC